MLSEFSGSGTMHIGTLINYKYLTIIYFRTNLGILAHYSLMRKPHEVVGN